MRKKKYNKKNEKIFSEPNSELTVNLTEETQDLTENLTEELTNGLTEGFANDLTPFMEVCSQLGISRETCYNRMEFLKIKPWKNKNRSFLDVDQFNHMIALHEHHKKQGNFEGFPVPTPSGPWEEEEINNNQVEINQKSAIILGSHDTAEITTSTPQQLSTINSPNFAPAAVRSQPSTEMEAINNLVASARNKATGVLIAENVLATQYIQNPDLLPEELKAKIKESAQTPVIDPFAYAESLMNFAQGVAF